MTGTVAQWRIDTTAALAALTATLDRVEGKLDDHGVRLAALLDGQASIEQGQTALTVGQSEINAGLAEVLNLLQQGPVDPPPPEPRFPGDPGEHFLYVGENRDGGDPATREAYFEHQVGCYRSYFQPDEVQAIFTRAARDLDAGRFPAISTKCPGTWASVADGTHDTWLRSLMGGIAAAALGRPVALCLHHEPADDVGAGQQPEDYRDMYRHLYEDFKISNILITPILQSAPFDPTVGGHGDITAWYDPAAMDLCGIDTYNHWYPGGTNKWREPDVVAGFFDQLTQFGKPIVLAEYGVRTDPAQPGRAATWLRTFHDLCVARGDVIAMSFFDSAQNVFDGGTPWTLDYAGDQERLDAFKGLLTAAGSAYLA